MRHPWSVFASLSLLYFVLQAGTFSSLGVVLPAMVQSLGWNWTEAGLGYTLLGVAAGLGASGAAVLIRRLGLSATMLIGTALLVAGFGALAVTRSVTLYLTAELLIGTAFALTTTVPATNLLTALFKRQSTVLGAYFTLGSLGGVAGPLLYVALHGSAQHWRVYWWCYVGACAVLGSFAAIATRLPRAAAAATDAALGQVTPQALIEGLHDWSVRRALASPQFYIIVGAYTMFLLINTTAHGFAVEHLTERGIPARTAAGILSLESLVAALVGVAGGIAGERIAARTLMAIALAALVVGMLGLAGARGLPLMLVYVGGVGIGYGLSFLAATMLLLRYFGRSANLELYSIMCLISTSAALGPAVGGWARDTLGSFTSVFVLCAAATLVMLFATIFMTSPVAGTAAERPLG